MKEPKAKKAFSPLSVTAAILAGACILWGLRLTEGVDPFYNILLMPAAGALCYGAFRWRAMYILPLFLGAAGFVMNRLWPVWGDSASLLWWMGIYCLPALAGTAAAGLLHFAFRKEDRE